MEQARSSTCDQCGAVLARDNSATVCSPCRRAQIEALARRSALISRDPAGARVAFAAQGLRGVAAHLRCTTGEALDVLVVLGMVPPAYRRRLPLLRQLVALDGASHIAAAEALGLSRWTVATYRRDLGLDRLSTSYSRPERNAAAIA